MSQRFSLDGYYHPDARRVPGKIVFDGRAISFQGGEGTEWVELSTVANRISAFELTAHERAVVVWDGRRPHRFSGPKVRKLAQCIEAALDARRRKGEEIPFLTELGEQLLGYGEAYLASTPAASCKGLLYVTDRRVHFERNDAAMARGPLAPSWSAWLRSLRGSVVDAGRGWWRAEAAGGRRALFRGEFALRAAAIVDSLEQEAPVPPTPWVDQGVREPSRPEVPLRLVGDDDDLRLLRTDAGSSDALRAHASLRSLAEVRSHRDGANWHVQLRFDTGSWTLECDEVWDTVHDLVWASLAASPALDHGPLDDYFHLVQPVACWLDSQSARFGWLALGDQNVHFIPRPAPGLESASIQVPVREVMRGDSGADASSLIQILGKGTQLVLSPAEGEVFVRAFWSRWECIVDQCEGERVSEETDVTRMEGAATLVRISRNGQGLIQAEECFVSVESEHNNTVSVLFSGIPDKALDIGLTVRVEIARPDAMYAFDGVVWWLDRAVHAPTGVADVFRGYRLELALPEAVHRYNRRDDFRVPVEPPRVVHVRQVDGGCHREPAMLLDLSVSGCRLSSSAAVPPHSQLELDVPAGNRTLKLRAVVLHVFGPRGPQEACQLGVRFHQPDARDLATLTSEVMSQQRTLLRDRLFVRESLEEAFSA